MLLPVLLSCLALAPVAAGALLATPQHLSTQAGQCKITQNHSLVGNTRTSLRFVNETKGVVRVDWLSYTGARVLYKKLAPGAGYTQSTWFTHPWVVLNSGGRCIGYVIAGTTRRYLIR